MLVAAPEPTALRAGALDGATTSYALIPLGGLGEVGKNMTVYELGDEIIVVDAGLAFPRDEHLGVDVILPDFGYLRGKQVRAVVLTHAHEDHVGALPYLMREIRVERDLGDPADPRAREVEARRARSAARGGAARGRPEEGPIQLGPFELEFIRMAHSIPDAVGIAIETGAGRVFHSGDWKLDHTRSTGCAPTSAAWPSSATAASTCSSGTRRTPSGRGSPARSASSARRSGRSSRPAGPDPRLSFASNIHRMQQAIDVGVDSGRKVAVVGRSMRKNMNIARNLGYIEVPEDVLVKPADLDGVPPRRAADHLHRLVRASRCRR